MSTQLPPALECHDAHCITCSDEGLPMNVVAIDTDRGMALCTGEDGARSSIDIALVGPLQPGDAILVHAGVALVQLSEAAIVR